MKNENTILVVSNNPNLAVSEALNQFKLVDPDGLLDKRYAELEDCTETILNELAENFEGLDWAYKLINGDELTSSDEASIIAFIQEVESDKDTYNVQLSGTGAKDDPYRYILSLPAGKPVAELKLSRWENPEGRFLSADIHAVGPLTHESYKALIPSFLVIANENGQSILYEKEAELLNDDEWSDFVKSKPYLLCPNVVQVYQGTVSY